MICVKFCFTRCKIVESYILKNFQAEVQIKIQKLSDISEIFIFKLFGSLVCSCSWAS